MVAQPCERTGCHGSVQLRRQNPCVIHLQHTYTHTHSSQTWPPAPLRSQRAGWGARPVRCPRRPREEGHPAARPSPMAPVRHSPLPSRCVPARGLGGEHGRAQRWPQTSRTCLATWPGLPALPPHLRPHHTAAHHQNPFHGPARKSLEGRPGGHLTRPPHQRRGRPRPREVIHI